MRLCPGLPEGEWSELVESHNLSEWMAVPLDGELYPHLLDLQNRLDDLVHLAEHDALTGLANRRFFERVLDVEVERAHRNRGALTLVVLDIDDFKRINDTHGHPCGDKVLRRFADLLKQGTRRYDLAARIGGEEFALVLSGVGQLRSQAMLARLMDDIREIRVECDGQRIPVTCSVGIVSYKGRVSLETEKLIEMADKALYEAKAAGKDRVVTAPIPDMAESVIDKTLVHSNEKKFLFSGIK
jgi:diguanylate cyclase (GGDEF)-like protein